MFRWLLEFDKKIFLYLNGIHSAEWDTFMVWITGNVLWIPLYVFLLSMIIYWGRPYSFIFTILFLAIAVGLSDYISVIIKNLVERPRPSHNSEITHLVHIVNNYRGGRYGFVSSHAANVFAAASFLTHQFKHYKWNLLLFGWATLVSYSRIYLGVHYPLDIICGATLGILIGMQCFMFKVWAAVFVGRFIEKRRKNKQKTLML